MKVGGMERIKTFYDEPGVSPYYLEVSLITVSGKKLRECDLDEINGYRESLHRQRTVRTFWHTFPFPKKKHSLKPLPLL